MSVSSSLLLSSPRFQCRRTYSWFGLAFVLAFLLVQNNLRQVAASQHGRNRRPLLFPLVQSPWKNKKTNDNHCKAKKKSHNSTSKRSQQLHKRNKPKSSRTSTRSTSSDESDSASYLSPELTEDENADNDSHSHHHHSVAHSLLQVPCAIGIADNISTNSNPTAATAASMSTATSTSSTSITKVTAIVDTGAQVTVLSKEAAFRAQVAHLMDQRYAGQATGVGSCRVLGRIPAGALLLHLGQAPPAPAAGAAQQQQCTVIKSPAITVLDNNNMGMELLLGMDFLHETRAILNMQDHVMILQHGYQPQQHQSVHHQQQHSSSGGGGGRWNEQQQQHNCNQAVVIPFLSPKTNALLKSSGAPTATAAAAGGWINKDIVKSLELYDCSDDGGEEEDNEDDQFRDLDMSGV